MFSLCRVLCCELTELITCYRFNSVVFALVVSALKLYRISFLRVIELLRFTLGKALFLQHVHCYIYTTYSCCSHYVLLCKLLISGVSASMAKNGSGNQICECVYSFMMTLIPNRIAHVHIFFTSGKKKCFFCCCSFVHLGPVVSSETC